MPDLSLVVISYNTKKLTQDCLESIFANSGTLSIQVILVDNASNDGSVAMVKELFPSVQVIENDENIGFAAANNQGFELALSDLVLLLNSDTIVLDGVLTASVQYMRKNLDTGAFGCRVLNTDGTMQPTCSGYPTIPRLMYTCMGLDRIRLFSRLDRYLLRYWQRNDEREVEVISGCYLLVRRTVIEQVGGLDEQFFFFGEETDWCLHMRKAGWRLKFAPVGEIIHHGGGSVKKLNHKRDVMLTAAIVRLHRKNSGRMAAAAAFSILLIFNASRAVYWSLRASINRSAKPRAQHFRQVSSASLTTWPKG